MKPSKMSGSTRNGGVRMALGASSRDVRRLVFGEAAVLTGVGFALGLADGVPTSDLLRGLVIGVRPNAPWTVGIVIAGLAVVGSVACYVPVRRATRIDPVALLRRE